MKIGPRRFLAIGIGVAALTAIATVAANTPSRGAEAADPIQVSLDEWMHNPIDNKVVLPGGVAATVGVELQPSDNPGFDWHKGFDSTGDSFTWTVKLTEPTRFVARAMLTSGSGDGFRLQVVDGAVAEFGPSSATGDFDLINAGEIVIPAGVHELRLTKTQSSTSSLFKSIELIRQKDYADYQQRAAAFKADTSWLRGERGFMVQWGGWSYPKNGPAADFQTIIKQFDVNAFVDQVVASKANYVVWSVTWQDALFAAPLASVDAITGTGTDRTATRDLLGEVATALDNAGIRLMFYYHPGYTSPEFWAAQQWPTNFNTTGLEDRSTFFHNWENIVSEIGARYGTKLSGWLFAEGLVSYPADFERIGEIARTGNPARLISYDGDIGARLTDFQDVYFGRQRCDKQPMPDAAGIYPSGPQAGLFAHCMERVNNAWGIDRQDQSADPATGGKGMLERFERVPDQGAYTADYLMWNGPTFVPDQAAQTATADTFANPVVDLEVGLGGVLFGRRADGELVELIDGVWSNTGRKVDSLTVRTTTNILATEPTTTVHNTLQRLYGRWRNITNDGYDIVQMEYGSDGSIYARTANNGFLFRANGHWTRIPGTGSDVTVGSATSAWVVGTDNQPWQWNGSAWTRNGTNMTFADLDVGEDGTLFGILTNGQLWRRIDGTWQRFPGVETARDVSATSANDFWVIDEHGFNLHYVNGSWTIVQKD